jgi:hypothetical protein
MPSFVMDAMFEEGKSVCGGHGGGCGGLVRVCGRSRRAGMRKGGGRSGRRQANASGVSM